MKDIELKLLSELMKNSRRSDRELAKTIGISQPTVTRVRQKLEKEGVIKEYTTVPDFSKLGFGIMAVMMFKLKALSAEELGEIAEGSARTGQTRTSPIPSNYGRQWHGQKPDSCSIPQGLLRLLQLHE